MPAINTPQISPADYQEKLAQLAQQLRQELESLQRESSEIDLLARQVQGEVEKLSGRETQLKSRVRDMELNLENYTPQDMTNIDGTAHENDLRLLMMRNQIEQLQSRKTAIKAQQQAAQRSLDVIGIAPDGFTPQGVARGLPARGGDGGGRMPAAQDVVVRVIQAQEDERLRISRQMHDGPAQAMTNLVLRAEICERLIDIDVARARSELAGLKTLVNDTLQNTRRFIFDLRPMILDDLGLEPTLRRYLQQFGEKNKIEVNFTMQGIKDRLPQPIEVAAYRIIQEALNNVARHAHADHVQVAIEVQDGTLLVMVEDNGSGFNVDEVETRSETNKYLGLAAMRQRAEMFGGEIFVESTPGRGTRVTSGIPLQ
jgi:two-component system sensor histidine kinase DegS